MVPPHYQRWLATMFTPNVRLRSYVHIDRLNTTPPPPTTVDCGQYMSVSIRHASQIIITSDR